MDFLAKRISVTQFLGRTKWAAREVYRLAQPVSSDTVTTKMLARYFIARQYSLCREGQYYGGRSNDYCAMGGHHGICNEQWELDSCNGRG